MLRMRNLFGGVANMAMPGLDTSRLDTPDMPDNTQPDDSNTNLLSQFQPKTTNSDRLTEALGNMPERPTPSRLRQIGASIAGLGAGSSAMGISSGQPIGFKFNPASADLARDKVNYGDFDNQLNDYQNKIKTLALGANEEDKANAGEVKRIAGEEQRNINQQKADILQQIADTLAEKNKNIYETKKAENLRKVGEADAKLALAKQALDLKKDSIEALQDYHKAELASIDARRKAQTEDDAFKLDETKRMHDAQIARLKVLNDNTGAGKEADTSYTYDKQGNITGRKTVTKPASGMVRMLAKDGKTEVDVPSNKVDDFINNYGGSRK